MGTPISGGQPRPIGEITRPPARRGRKEVKQKEGHLGMGRNVQKCQRGGRISGPRGTRRTNRIGRRSRRKSPRQLSPPSLKTLNKRCSVFEKSKKELFNSLGEINRTTKQLKNIRTRLINDMKRGVNLEKQLNDVERQLRLVQAQGKIHNAALLRLK